MRASAIRPSLPLPIRLHASTTAKGSGICIAMVDSDFMAHPDLTQPNVRVACYYDAVNDREGNAPSGTPQSRHWHGTMTACTAAGNGYLSQGEFSSLAPEATVVLIRTMNDEGRITTAAITQALEWVERNATRYGIRVVNMSVYADEYDQTLHHPVTAASERMSQAGIVMIAAAGNNPLTPIRPPASAPSVITVGGLDDKNSYTEDDAELYNSTFGVTALGVQKPEVVAPAIWLPAPILPGTAQQKEAAAFCALDAMSDEMLLQTAPTLLPYTSLPVATWTLRNVEALRARIAECIRSEQIVTPWYKMVDGTSFAAPIVASIAAQMLSIAPQLSPAEIKSLLMRTARPLANYPAVRQGAGVVQQRDALRMLQAGITKARAV